jgi:multiple antibiotic resistance protein
MALLSAVVTLFLVMDPLGNVPLFLSVLKGVPAERRRVVIARELAIAFFVLVLFLLAGGRLMQFLGLEQPAIGIAGGIVLFLIAIRMVFPSDAARFGGSSPEGEPFIVPLAIPLIAGPSALATVILLQATLDRVELFGALAIAWGVTALILLSSTMLYRVLRERGLIAVERLMGMLLVMVAVQMFMDGVKAFLAR